MSTYTSNEYPHIDGTDQVDNTTDGPFGEKPHLVIQILSIIAFGVIGIVAVAMAFSAFWVAGLLTTAVLAAAWSKTSMFGGSRRECSQRKRKIVLDVAPSFQKSRSSGNASFDAYRSEMIESLEQESREFDGFLARLREAEGEMEFDGYMDDRARAAQDARAQATLDDDDSAKPAKSKRK